MYSSSVLLRLLPVIAFSLSTGILSPFTVNSEATAPSTLLVDKARKHIKLSDSADIYIDQSASLTIDQVADPTFENNFVKMSDLSIKGYLVADPSIYWLRLEIINTTNEHIGIVVENWVAVVNIFDIHLLRGSGLWESAFNGIDAPGGDRSFIPNVYFHRIIVEPEETLTMYLRIGQTPTLQKVWISDEITAQKTSFYKWIFYGVVWGGMLALALYNLFIYFTLRDTSYILYTIYAFTSLYLLIVKKGELLYLSPSLTFSEVSYQLHQAVVLMALAAFLFTRRFLDTANRSRKFDCFLLLVFSTIFILGLWALIDPSPARMTISGTFILFILAVSLAITGARFWWLRAPGARYYAVAWNFPAGAFLISSLMLQDILPWNVFTLNSMEIGFFLDNILLSMALGDRIGSLENEKRRAEKMAMTDSLTGLYNRRAFHEVGAHEVIRCNRFGHSLSLITLDIDHFKNINDTYGHIVGDKALQHLARILSDGFREVDLIARIGGEEFAILLPETDDDLAVDIAERLRKNIENYSFKVDDSKISFTSSFGVSTKTEKIDTLDKMLQNADQAMYKAKENGRNNVVILDENRAEKMAT